MSRFECDYEGSVPGEFWSHRVEQIARGKRGQKLLRDLIAALLALPERKLCANYIAKPDGSVCVNGALARYKGLDLTEWVDVEGAGDVTTDIGESAGLPYTLSWELGYLNDNPIEALPGLLTDQERARYYRELHERAERVGKHAWNSEDCVTDEERWAILYRWAATRVRWQLPAAVNA